MALQLDPEDYEALGFAAHYTLTFHEIEATRLSIDKQYKPSKEQVALYNRRYYLKRKAAQPPKPKKVPLTLSEINRRYYLKHKEKILARRKMWRGLRAAVIPKKGEKDVPRT